VASTLRGRRPSPAAARSGWLRESGETASGVRRRALVAAVSNAGGMGFLGGDQVLPSDITKMIRTTRHLTSRPFGISFSARSVTGEHLKRCADERPAVVVLSRGRTDQWWTDELQTAGIEVWRHVASPVEGVLAVRQGADAVIVDGGEITNLPPYWALLDLLPTITKAVFPIPTIAAGGVRDGRRLATALVLGAEAAWCGARFLSSTEVLDLYPTAGAARHARPAAEIVRELSREASTIIESLHSTLRGPA
jgi:NAD(P)H-dependent flavin oxidoreductase YrpB (nitropropane dioxygenase family)